MNVLTRKRVFEAHLKAIELFEKQDGPFPNPYLIGSPEWNEFFKTWANEKRDWKKYQQSQPVKALRELKRKEGLTDDTAFDVFNIILPTLLKNAGLEDLLEIIKEESEEIDFYKKLDEEEEERNADPVEAFAGVPRGS
jgi:hypothetical protein|tara:strand:+ start:283 stop:696 length:414 start_codon:yes stop_codon:yes gene_type:complete